MRDELVITEEILRNQFQEERDLVTLDRYRVGDRVAKCANCRKVVKTEHIIASQCPLCNSTFRSMPFSTAPQTIRNQSRDINTFFVCLMVSAVFSLLPLAFPALCDFTEFIGFGISTNGFVALALIISFITAFILYYNEKCRRIWRLSSYRYLLALVPATAPYLLSIALCLTFFAASVIFTIIIIIVIAGIIFGS